MDLWSDLVNADSYVVLMTLSDGKSVWGEAGLVPPACLGT